jgi:peroxiredoxin
MHLLRSFVLVLLAIGFAHPGHAADVGNFGQEAPDFPPGLFSDGQQYRLADFRGKVVVLFIYESMCPTCKATIPERNKLVKAMANKPVKFIAVGASDTMLEVNKYARETGLAMPIFIDSLGLMEKRYGQAISLKNIYQIRVIGPDGKVVGLNMKEDDISKAAEKANWTYPREDYHAKLVPALDCFEWNQYLKGMKLLLPLRKSPMKPVAESAEKLLAAVKEEGQKWKEEADKAAEDKNLVEAYDLYAKVATVFAGDELGKSADVALKKLSATKAVKDELAARKAYTAALTKSTSMTPMQKKLAAAMFSGIAKKFPDTPTAEKATALAQELGD